MKDVLVIITGGTIDAEPYSETPQNVRPLAVSMVPKLLEEIHASNCEIKQWIMKDSKDFSGPELNEITDYIKNSGYKKIIITHGTDAMVDNAKVIKALLTKTDIMVIFTGAMQPLTHGHASDGRDNLAYSLQQIEKIPAGVYIVGSEELANGKIAPGLFEAESTKKNFLKKVFERLGRNN